MQKHFYTHIVEIDSIYAALDEIELGGQEKQELMLIVASHVHQVVVDTVLSELSEEDKKIFLMYLERITGSYALGMSIFSIIMIGSALFEVPTGIFSDFIGRRKTVILGAFAAVLYVTFYAIGTNYYILAI